MAVETTFELLPAAEKIAAELIPQHHRELSNARIRYVLSSEKPGKKGCKKFAKIELLADRHRWLVVREIEQHLEDGVPDDEDAPEIVIWFPMFAWAVLQDSQRRALVDHMLAHILVDEDGDYVLVGHDVSEFIAIRERHGAWLPELRRFGAGTQLPMDMDGASPPRTREDAADLAESALRGAFAGAGVTTAVVERGG